MAYIGRGIENLVNTQKLDVITPSTATGAGPYNLTKDSVAFVPASAEQMIISINGVIQYGNFTVNSSTVTFDAALTDSDVCDFIYQMGTGLLTTPVDGSVNTAQLANDSITTAKILDANITTSKIADTNVTTSKIADDNVTTSKIADGNVTSAKLSYPLTTFSSTGIDDNATSTAIGINSNEQVILYGQQIQANNNTSNITYSGGNNSNAGANLTLFGGSHASNPNVARFRSSATEVMRIDSSGHAIIPAGVTLGTSAGTYNASNTLDDYEEGTWTPVFAGSTTAGSFTYTTQVGTYTKIGRLVTVNCELLNITEVSGAVGSLKITGLPFTSSSTNNSFGSCDINRFSFTGYEYAVANLGTSKNFVYILRVRTGNSSAILDVSHRDGDSSDVKFTISYEV